MTDKQSIADVRALSRQEIEVELIRMRRSERIGESHGFLETTGWRTTNVTPDILFAAAEKTRMPMIITDPNIEDNPIIFVNRAFQELTGYANDELVGRNCRFLQGPDTDRAQVAEIKRALAAREDVVTEILNYRKDGTTFWNELYITYVYGTDGRLLYHFGSQLNVSPNVATRLRLEATEARYNLLFQAINAGFGIIELKFDGDDRPIDYRFVEVNRTFARETGLGDVSGQWASEFLPGADRHWLDTYGEVSRTGEAVRFEHEWEAAGRWFDIHAFRIGPPDARRVAVLFNDISTRRRHEDSLRELNETLEQDLTELTHERDQIWTLIPDLLALGAIDGRLLLVNPAWNVMLGYVEEDLTGTQLMALIHADCHDAYESAFEALRNGRTARFQSEVLAADGSYRWFEWVCAPTRGFFYAVARDITEQKRTVLSLRIAKRDAEEARSLAEAANLAKSEFLAAMSHEIRTPLHGVIGYADLLMNSDNLGDNQIEQLKRLHSAASALLTIVNDILDFAKIEAGQVELEFQPFSLQSLVDETTAIVRWVAERKGLELRVEVDPAVPDQRVGDADRLRQVLLNLLNNAIKFTPKGFVVLRVAVAADPDRLRFDVEDSGIGIPFERRHRLFERFSQVDGSIRRDFGGTGLGLAICRRLVGLMLGEIDVSSEPGRGSLFHFTAMLPEAEVEDLIASAGTQAARALPEADGAIVLVVDDIEVNLDIARSVLEQAGHQVDVATDGAAAVKAVKDKEYDLVLMDVQMPGMDGMAATEHIRALAAPKNRVPIVAMTANVLPQQVTQLLAAGMDDHIGKPFKQDELRELASLWRRRRRRLR